jgi:uncharacterized protein (DUF1800 family)
LPPRPHREIWPDENYAREVMQVFTLGLYQARASQQQ